MKVRQDQVRILLVAGPSLALEPNVSPGRLSFGNSNQERPSVPGAGVDSPPQARDLEAVGLASNGYQLKDSILSTEFVDTILNARALS